MVYWLYSRPIEQHHRQWLRRSSPRSPRSPRPTSRRSRRAGTTARPPRLFQELPLRGRAGAALEPGTYRNITGNEALALGLVAAAERSGLPLFLGSYPITPGVDILHELAKLQALRRDHVPGRGRDRRGVRGDRRGFGGSLGVTALSGPGIALKARRSGLA
jgi:2-oxoglutarate/2-oxoacid ferredoxin oxidoreductase subunit alpha